MPTPFSKSRHSLSKKAHSAAKSQVYPDIFRVERDKLVFEYPGMMDTDKDEIMDQKLSIDVTCRVSTTHLERPVYTTFQERWRRRKYQQFQDVTVTELNQKTGTSSEHYKISSGFHLYGYYDEDINKVLEAIAFSVPNWQMHVIQNNFNTMVNEHPTSKSRFVSYDFDELIESGVAVFHQKYGETKYHYLD